MHLNDQNYDFFYNYHPKLFTLFLGVSKKFNFVMYFFMQVFET